MKHPLLLILAIVAAELTVSWYGIAHGAESSRTLAAIQRIPVHRSDTDEGEIARAIRLTAFAEAIDAATPNRTERAWLIMTARRESGLARYVTEDHARCSEGHGGRCDSGRAFGAWQLHGTSRALTVTEQATEALARLRRAQRYCSVRGHDLWTGGTSAYATGARCDWAEAEERVAEMRVVEGRL